MSDEGVHTPSRLSRCRRHRRMFAGVFRVGPSAIQGGGQMPRGLASTRACISSCPLVGGETTAAFAAGLVAEDVPDTVLGADHVRTQDPPSAQIGCGDGLFTPYRMADLLDAHRPLAVVQSIAAVPSRPPFSGFMARLDGPRRSLPIHSKTGQSRQLGAGCQIARPARCASGAAHPSGLKPPKTRPG